MTAIVERTPALPAMTPADADKVAFLTARMLPHAQLPLPTKHLIHAGMYARTICIPAGAVLTGVLIKRATTVILQGSVSVFTGGDTLELTGYHVLPASAGRRQAYLAHSDTYVTMIFPSTAQSVAEAEAEFTDETGLLLSREQGLNETTITGE